MLVLSRKYNESVLVGNPGAAGHMLKVTVIEIGSGHVMLGFEANTEIPIHRSEVWEKIHAHSPGRHQRSRNEVAVRRKSRAVANQGVLEKAIKRPRPS